MRPSAGAGRRATSGLRARSSRLAQPPARMSANGPPPPRPGRTAAGCTPALDVGREWVRRRAGPRGNPDRGSTPSREAARAVCIECSCSPELPIQEPIIKVIIRLSVAHRERMPK